MPETPEVAGLVDFLDRSIVGLRIAEVQVSTISAIKTADPSILTLGGSTVTAAGRRGKWIWLQLDSGPVYVAFHLSRGGWVSWKPNPRASRIRMGSGPLALRITFVDDAGEVPGALDLTEAGTQKRLAVYVVSDLEMVPGIARLGPDPLADDFTAATLSDILQEQGNRQLKTVLRDQSTLAGIGNAYSDEILNTARMSPTRRAESLDSEATGVLLDAIRETLTAAIAAAVGQPPNALKDGKRSTLRIHGHAGDPCPVCGTQIREVSGADTSYQYCPTCQTGGKILADRRMSRLLK